MNRFSNDIGAIDEALPTVLMDCLQVIEYLLKLNLFNSTKDLLIVKYFKQMGMRFLGIIFAIGLVNIYLMLPTVIVGIILYYIRVFYLPTSRSFKRLEGISK